ncbi:carbohydrate esterase family 4 protein [Moniliophthora roreri MCA 2997]|uniref:Carbohydrate esterase family 4 protein n=1 Tax=Moniliophthora roreri (strain MCA 2997) TaxID=1381753 RepID=V2WUX7_MONRO|nr:carbohydrate esterase family 4 protein [Moniliophthora roreri MCA 2997]
MKLITASLFTLVAASTALAAPSLHEERQAPPLATVFTTCKTPNTVAFTFDDGPWIYNDEIVAFLANQSIKATFFFNGDNYDCIYSQDTMNRVKNVYKNGHQVGSHTWAHRHLTTLNATQIDSEMARVDLALQRIIGITPAFMRPPYGEYNNVVRQVSAARGQNMVNWDFDSGDSVGATPSESKADYTRLIQSHPSTIIALNHETEQTTAEDVIRVVIPQLKAAGYNLVTVAECLGMQPYQNVTNPQTPDRTWRC